MFSKKTALVEFSEHEKPNTEESITYFKKVVETIKRSEDTMMLKDNLENFKNKEPNRKLAEIFPLKVSETASINAWDEVIRKSSESNESLVNEDYLGSLDCHYRSFSFKDFKIKMTSKFNKLLFSFYIIQFIFFIYIKININS